MEDLFDADRRSVDAFDEALRFARRLPGPGWRGRLAAGTPVGPVETFLALVRQQVYARNRDGDLSYTLEAEVEPAIPGLLEAAAAVEETLSLLLQPLRSLLRALAERLDEQAGQLDTTQRQRIAGLCRSIRRRGTEPLEGWRAMLGALSRQRPAEFLDWLAVERIDGREIDVGLFRHWIDPMRPFADVVLRPAHGALITSATLRDGSGDDDADWAAAQSRTGARHLPSALSCRRCRRRSITPAAPAFSS